MSKINRKHIALAALGFIAAAFQPVSVTAQDQVWAAFGGNQQAQKYSSATQITADNVKHLTQAWSIHTGDFNARTSWGATPLFVNNTVYVGTPMARIYAVEPATGTTKWVYTPAGKTPPAQSNNRGVAYWAAANPVASQPCQKIVYVGSNMGKLAAVDANTGKLCKDFGDKGVLNVEQWNTVNNKWPFQLAQPPAVYKDTLILGWGGNDWVYQTDSPGWVFGLDARTGRLKWKFNPIPADMINKTGTANVWASMSVDPDTGLVYLPVSSPEPNYYGGARLKEMPLVTSTTALNAETGKVVWSRQLVHHDIWDVDTDSAPTLVDIKRNGQIIPALVQATKMGFLLVLNRKTGEPIYPITEKPAPASDVPGEKASPTQPYAAIPEPTTADTAPPTSTLADILSFGQCSRWRARLREEGRFTPPSLRGTVAWPATVGGVEWGGGAVDPNTGTYVVNSDQVPQIYTLIPRAEVDKKLGGRLKANGYAAQAGAPYGFELQNFLNVWGMPCWAPPYGTLSSYDLNTGKLNWKKPFGQVQKWGFYMPESWGSVTIGGPAITKSGLVFIGASMDSRVRAIDLKSGSVLWKHLVDAPATAMPAIYTYKGKEYVVFAAGGSGLLTPRTSDQLVAFALSN